MFPNRFRYLIALLLASFCYLITVVCKVYYYFGIEIRWYHAFLTMLLVVFAAWESSRLIQPSINRVLSGSNNVRVLIGFFIAGNLISGSFTLLVVYTIGHFIYGYGLENLHNPIKLNLIFCFLMNLLFHLFNAIFYYLEEYTTQLREADQLKRMNSQAQVQLVKSQIHPHFLFNNLNVLSGMLIRDNPEANLFLEQFSKVYRYILSNQDKEVVELQKELDFIVSYLFLLKTRFDQGLQVNIQIPKEYTSLYVIPAALQMLIENAIKHNEVSSGRPLHLQILTEGGESLVVSNNIQPKIAPEPSSRIGLLNIQQRYEMISGRKVEIRQTASRFEVTIPLLHINDVS